MLLLLRYLLVIIPGITTLYVSSSIPSSGLYILLFLLYLFCLQLRDFRAAASKNDTIQLLATIVEILLLAAGCYYFGGLLPLAYLSTLTTLHDRKSTFLLLTVLIGACMNIAARPHYELETLIVLNLAYVSVAVLLDQYSRTQRRRLQLEAHYDSLKQQHHDLEETRRTVTDYAKKVEHYAQVEERNRIAHDLHDDLGHRLIRLKMMLEAATRLPSEQQSRAMELTSEVRDQLGESMESLRATVRRLKPAGIESAQYSLDGLLQQIARDSGIQVELLTEGAPYDLYPSEEIILYRNAQESITNAIRHGEATEVTITLAFAPDSIAMTVRNNGKLPEQPELRRGLGLQGMEDRLRVVGGKLSISTEPVFDIQTTLPRVRT